MLRNASLIDGRHSVAATSYGEQFASIRQSRCDLGNSIGTGIERLQFKGAEGAVPDERFRGAELCRNGLD